MKHMKLWLVCLLVTLLLIPILGTDAEATTDWTGYTPISTSEELNNIRNDLSGNYYLTQDIVLAEPTGDSVSNWVPVGTNWNPFSGVFDGNGHVISGLTMQAVVGNNSAYHGLFAYSTGTIRNLGLVDADIQCVLENLSGNRYIGAIAGYSSGTIQNCYTAGKLWGTMDKLVYMAGIAGGSGGTIENCFNAATMDNYYSAGICGTGGKIINCYSITDLTHAICRGDYTTLINCYSLGSESSDSSDSYKGYVRTQAQMQDAATYVGFDFTNVWEMSADPLYPYPVLRNVPVNIVPESISVTKRAFSVIYNEATKTMTLPAGEEGEIALFTTSGMQIRLPLTSDMLASGAVLSAGRQDITIEFAGKSAAMTTTVYTVASGEGTEANPYILLDKNHLKTLRAANQACYRLAADIIFEKEDTAWSPISSFSGQLDGAGHRIDGLQIESTVSYSSTGYVGLFGTCSGTVKNLGMVGCSIVAEGYIGINGTTGSTIHAGGIAGYLDGGTISQCYFTGSIWIGGGKTGRLGGIAGTAYRGSHILDCYNLGTLKGSSMTYCWLGGIVAHNYGEVARCYNAGKLYSANPRGVVGYDEYSVIKNTFYLNNGALSSSGATQLTEIQMRDSSNFTGFDFTNTWVMRKAKGYLFPELKNVPLKMQISSLAIETEPNGVIFNEKTGTATASGGKLKVSYTNGLTASINTREAKTSGVTPGSSGTKTIYLTYDGLRVQTTVSAYSTVASGTGTASNPYRISKKAHLNSLHLDPGANYLLTANLQFSTADFAAGGAFYNGGKLWLPVGEDYNTPFAGTFNGGNYTITGLKINNNYGESTAYLGMFGYVSGTVKNLRLRQVNLQGEGRYGSLGGIAGGVSGTITNCHVDSGSIVLKPSSSASIGGIVGTISRGTVSNCHSSSYVSAVHTYGTSANAGGIVGRIDEGSVKNSYNMGTVESLFFYSGGYGPYYAGGIAGVISGGTVSDCYNTGMIRASYGTGGIAGSSSGTITRCYNTEQIDRSTYGAIVGIQNGSMSNCYYLNNSTRGVGKGTDTAISCTAAQLKKKATFQGFDFSAVWTTSGSASYKYPELRANKMMTPLSVSKVPTAINAPNGKSAKVSVNASGDGLTYQWYLKKPGASKFTATTNRTKTYSLTMSKANAGTKVYCVITDQYGDSVKTGTVTLSNLVLTAQPKDATAANGKAVKATVKATGTGLKYRWYAKDPGSTTFKKTTVTTATYKCTMKKTINGRQVYCVITDKYGNTVTTETVTLSNLTITAQPRNVAVTNGKAASTTVKATGAGLKYQWYFKNATGKTFLKAKVTSATYTCTMSKAVAGRKVYCIITDQFGNSVQSATVTLRKR